VGAGHQVAAVLSSTNLKAHQRIFVMQLDERSSVATAVPNRTEAARDQVDRILGSNTFHASDVLRRLLRFLADKTFAGAADDLKEYSVGLDALGKPPTYDPRQDAAVRLHASRLRQIRSLSSCRKAGSRSRGIREASKRFPWSPFPCRPC
jgi:hypothetical protein